MVLDRKLVGTYVPALPRGFQPQVKATRFAGGRLLLIVSGRIK